jgi:hypothetical protein
MDTERTLLNKVMGPNGGQRHAGQMAAAVRPWSTYRRDVSRAVDPEEELTRER